MNRVMEGHAQYDHDDYRCGSEAKLEETQHAFEQTPDARLCGFGEREPLARPGSAALVASSKAAFQRFRVASTETLRRVDDGVQALADGVCGMLNPDVVVQTSVNHYSPGEQLRLGQIHAAPMAGKDSWFDKAKRFISGGNDPTLPPHMQADRGLSGTNEIGQPDLTGLWRHMRDDISPNGEKRTLEELVDEYVGNGSKLSVDHFGSIVEEQKETVRTEIAGFIEKAMSQGLQPYPEEEFERWKSEHGLD